MKVTIIPFYSLLIYSDFTYNAGIINISEFKKKITQDKTDMKLKEDEQVKFCITLDHRYVDGAYCGKVLKELNAMFDNPELILQNN